MVLFYFLSFASTEPEVVECPVWNVKNVLSVRNATFVQNRLYVLSLLNVPEVQAPQPKPKKTTVSVPVNVDPTTFPRTYTFKRENFSIIAQKIYGRASWAGWLAEQNGIDPSKLQIGQDYIARSERINRM